MSIEPDDRVGKEVQENVGGAWNPKRQPLSENQGTGFQPPAKIDIKEHEARTARTLTYVLVGMLAMSILVQYGTMAVLVANNKGEAIPTFEHLFNAVLPVLAGLTGAAVTYYLTKDKK